MPKLNQILAIAKNVKNKREDEFTKIHQNLTKGDLLFGFSKTYQPNADDGERFPPENKVVQVKAEDALKQLKSGLTELLDVEATKDATNQHARGTVVIDGKALLSDVPATHLLYIEKKLVDLITVIKKLPTLPQDEQWTRNASVGLWQTAPISTVKTRKLEKYETIVQPTKEHPAQVVKHTVDETIGHWSTVKYSGALPVERVAELLERAERLQKAVKFAREEANQTTAVEPKTGAAVLSYIFG